MRLKQLNLCMSLLHRGSRTKPSDHRHEVTRPVVVHPSRIVVQWNPYLCGCRGETEIPWHDPDDLAVHPFELNRPANDGSIASETLRPKSVTQDDVVVLAL